MPRPPSTTIDPMFAEITKTIYGDVDAREIAALAKFSPGSSDLHVDGSLSEKEAKRQKRVAQTGLAATGVATVAGLDATRTSIKEFRHRAAEGKEGRAVGPVARKLVRLKMSPKAAGLAVGTGLLGLHGVELASDALGAHAQTKALRQANTSLPNTKKPVAKAFRLKPLNTLPNLTPSLRAKRVKLTPSPANPRTRAGLYQPVGKGLRSYIRAGRTTLRNVKNTSEHAQQTAQNMSDASGKFSSMFTEHGERAAKDAADAARNASEATDKIKRLIPSRRTAVLAATGTVGALAGLPAAGSYAGSYAGNRHGNKKRLQVAKSASIDVTWSGVISKVDTDKRRVFGWASVSAINGEQVVDLQGDIVPIEEVEKSAYRYVIESRKGGDMHKRVSKLDQPMHTSDMIESFVVTPEKLEKMGLPPDALPHGWWVGYHVNDDAQWAMVKSGERTGFSIHGKGSRTPVSKSLDDIKDKAGDVKDKAAKQLRRTTGDLKRRANQAINPPAVKTHRVKSSAIRSMGYQPQTRRLAVEMRSRPGQPYEYKMKTGAAMDALTAPSKGAHFATQIRGKAKRAGGYTPADRARLFLDPVSKASPKEIGPRPPQYGHRDEGFGSGARRAEGRRITDKPSRYSLKGNAGEFRRGAGGGFKYGATRVTYGGPGGDKYARKVFHHAFKQKVAAEALDSPHGGAFRAGVRAGRSSVHAVKYGPYALLGTGVVAAGKKVADDHREADRRIAARQQSVGKRLGSGAGYAAIAVPIALAGGFGGYVAGSEMNRKLYNKHGAQLQRFEAVTHPIRAHNKAFAGASRKAATVQLNRAEKTTNPRRAEYHRIRAERFNTEANRYARQAGIRKAAQVYEPAITGLPGDNRQAQMARSRRKTGLGVAGAGYLVATRGKDIAPEIASLGTRSAKKIGAGKYANLVARRAKAISAVTGKGGAALVGGGLALAGEGAVADLHHRNQYARARKQVSEYARNHPGRKQFQKSAFGIEDDRIDKAYRSGEITLHQEQANLHSRRKAAADRRIKGGLSTAGAGAVVAGAAHGAAPHIGQVLSGGRTGDEVARRLKIVGNVRRYGPLAGAGVAAAGLGMAGEGLVNRSRNAHKQNREANKAQLARRSRNATLGKAFDSERSRHGRQDIYAGTAAGGATIAGAGAVVAGRQARGNYRAAAGTRERAAGSSSALREHLARMAQPTQTGGLGRSPKNIAQAQKLHRTTRTQAATAERILTRAKRLTRVSGGLGAGAAALGGVAYGLHNYDRRRGGRSYGY